MKENTLTGHPCFSREASQKFGRIHLAVAPKCNISCGYCNRKFDCANESRPGVTAKVLSPSNAFEHFERSKKLMPYINTVGIAGPGDALANPRKTFETLEMIKSRYPETHLCLSTNALMLPEFVPEIKELKVSHVTVTVNAGTPQTASNIYGRVTKNGVTYKGEEGAALLLENQYRGISLLKENGIIIKVNFIYIPGVNDHEIDLVIDNVAGLGANLFNIMPFIPIEKTPFARREQPDEYEIFEAQQKVLRYSLKGKASMALMNYCQQCRSDAAGYLDEETNHKDLSTERHKNSSCSDYSIRESEASIKAGSDVS